MKNLFIDTNIWLSLYHFTNDDLTQFEKLKNYIGDSINLIVPRQVQNEIIRNRESKIKDALKDFDFKAPKYPVFCQGYNEYEEISKEISSLAKRFKEWRSIIDKDIQNQELPADKVINSFLKSVNIIPCTSFIRKAHHRYLIGNPPGKDNKYGDAINWECLLETVEDGEDLYFISADKDYSSLLDNKRFNYFLEKEWHERKKSDIVFYTNLVDFLNEHVDDIKLQTEKDKQHLIKELSHSGSYESTHRTIAKLNKHTGWTEQQIEELCSIAVENGQVGRIFSDYDVMGFYFRLISDFDYDSLDDCNIKRVIELLEEINNKNKMEKEFLEDLYAEMADALEEYYKH